VAAYLAVLATLLLVPAAVFASSSGGAKRRLQRELSADMKSLGGASGAYVVDL